MFNLLLNVNWGAVVVAVIIAMVLGYLWYSNWLFANAWMKEIGKTREQLGNPGPAMGAMLVAALVEAYALALFMRMSGVASLRGGVLRGVLVAVGFVATTFAAEYVFAGRSRKLYAITVGYHGLSILLMGVLYGLWR